MLENPRSVVGNPTSDLGPSGSSFGPSSLAPVGIHHHLLTNLTTAKNIDVVVDATTSDGFLVQTNSWSVLY